MPTQPSSPEVVAKSGPRKSIARDLRRLAAVGVVGAGLVGIGIAEYSAPAVAQFKPGTPAETLSFADIVERVKPAVVSISTTNEVKVADRGRSGPGAGPGAGPGRPSVRGHPRPARRPSAERVLQEHAGRSRGGGGGNPMQQRPRQAPARASSSPPTATSSPTITSSTAPARSRSASTTGRDRRRARRHRPAHRPRPAEDQADSKTLPVRQVRGEDARASATGCSRSAIRSASAAR